MAAWTRGCSYVACASPGSWQPQVLFGIFLISSHLLHGSPSCQSKFLLFIKTCHAGFELKLLIFRVVPMNCGLWLYHLMRTQFRTCCLPQGPPGLITALSLCGLVLTVLLLFDLQSLTHLDSPLDLAEQVKLWTSNVMPRNEDQDILSSLPPALQPWLTSLDTSRPRVSW